MPSSEVRTALIVATSDYQDPGLAKLHSPAQDAQQLARVLADQSIGSFDVHTIVNEPHWLIVEELEAFFADRRRDDLLLLYLSCHGVKDDDGHLYFAAENTKRNRLASTAISADWLNQQIGRGRSNRVVLLLDCCYSGAFARGIKGDSGVAIKERFDGRGRVVLTASNSIEYSFEGSEVLGSGQPSVFTDALVQGLASGEADRGGDGLIDVDELYEYIYGKVRETRTNQTPGKWALGVEGELYVARSRAPVRPVELPPELMEAVKSPLPLVRAGAVATLVEFLVGGHAGIALSARVQLQRLADEDDSRRVSQAAREALTDAATSPVTTWVEQGTVDPRHAPSTEEEARRKAEEEARRKAEEEARRKAEEAWPRGKGSHKGPIVFMSYRREDTGPNAAYLADILVQSYGKKNVLNAFSIQPGGNGIRALVESCDVVLALIGSAWLSVADNDGRRRLDNAQDVVRLEIEAALAKRIPIIPILFQGTRMPREDELPEAISDLSRRHALEIPNSPQERGHAVERLKDSIDENASRHTDVVAGTVKGVMSCPECRELVAAGTVFCLNCGSAVAPSWRRKRRGSR